MSSLGQICWRTVTNLSSVKYKNWLVIVSMRRAIDGFGRARTPNQVLRFNLGAVVLKVVGERAVEGPGATTPALTCSFSGWLVAGKGFEPLTFGL
jgi:hypothetical protein